MPSKLFEMTRSSTLRVSACAAVVRSSMMPLARQLVAETDHAECDQRRMNGEGIHHDREFGQKDHGNAFHHDHDRPDCRSRSARRAAPQDQADQQRNDQGSKNRGRHRGFLDVEPLAQVFGGQQVDQSIRAACRSAAPRKLSRSSSALAPMMIWRPASFVGADPAIQQVADRIARHGIDIDAKIDGKIDIRRRIRKRQRRADGRIDGAVGDKARAVAPDQPVLVADRH